MASRVEKQYYQFNKGINTEGSLIAFPEGFSADEENYDLKTDGSRRRRKGLALETNGQTYALASNASVEITDVVDGLVGLNPRRTITTITPHGYTVGQTVHIAEVNATGTFDVNGTWEILTVPTTTTFRVIGSGDPNGSYVSGGIAYLNEVEERACRAFRWEGVSGDLTLNFKIVQIGGDLYIYEDTGTVLSTHRKSTAINLLTYKVPASSDSDVVSNFVDVASGRGDAIVVGKYIQPFYIRYDIDAASFTVTTITLRERDFEGVDDGIDVTVKPLTLSEVHSYNLQNRGWTPDLIDDFFTDKGLYPSKAMMPWLGLKRTLTSANSYDNDGVRVFSPDKLVAELFQNTSAPQGHFIRDPFSPSDVTGGTFGVAALSWSFSGIGPGLQTVTINTDGPHSLAVLDEFTWPGATGTVTFEDPGYGTSEAVVSFPGTFVVSATPDADTLQFQYTLGSEYDLALTPITMVTGGTIVSTSTEVLGENIPYRPTTTAFYAGRVWYAGAPYKRQAGRIYFSQIVENDVQYGSCHQVADPTDERISDIVATDGGVIVIPEVGSVLKLLPYGAFLLVFATNGVWQIGGNSSSGFFSAVSYSIRKITEQGCISGTSVVLGNNIPYYGGFGDIYVITQDPNSGLLVAGNITESTIHTLYASLVAKGIMQGEYDDVERRVVWLCNSDSETPSYAYDQALCFHTVLGAFTKYSFTYNISGYVSSVFSMREPTSVDKRLKFVGLTDAGTVLQISELNSTDFLDFDNDEETAYIISGPETLGDASKFRYAPYVWVFSKKTETGYTSTGPSNDSSTKLQARWDWADLSVSGKWGTEQEVYRHLRMYTPASSSDGFDDGVPLVVTRNKVRGRGRALQIKLTAGVGKDSYIAGWHVKTDVHTET
jgi:hypothetical protein